MGSKNKLIKETTKKNDHQEQNEENSLTKTILIFLIYAFYLLGGLFNEKLTKTNYSTDKSKTLRFKYPSINLCSLSFLSILISSYMSSYTRNKLKLNPSLNPISFRDKSIIGIFYSISMFSSQISLLYLDFIVKTIGRSLKSAAIMFLFFLNSIPLFSNILKKVLNNNEKEASNKISSKDLIKVTMTTISVLLFNLSSGNDKKNNDNSNSTLGILFLIISLLADGLLSLKEKLIQGNIYKNSEYKGYEKIICWEYMKIFGFFTFLFGLCQIIFNCIFGNYINVLKIVFTNKMIIKDLLVYSVCESLGQSIIFIFLGKYGPLALSMVSSVRKMLSISLSIFYFGKSISIFQGISLFLAALVIVSEIFDKGGKSKAKGEKEIKNKKLE